MGVGDDESKGDGDREKQNYLDKTGVGGDESKGEMETDRGKITLIRQETDRVKITFIRQELVTTCLGSTTSTSGSHTATCPITLMSKP